MTDILLLVIDYLIAQEVATAKDVDIFKDFYPETPDQCISVFEYSGVGPAPQTNTSVRSIQIACRSKSGQQAMQKCWQCYEALFEESLIVSLGEHKCIVAMRNTPIKIDRDDEQRTIYAFNMGITINNI